MQINLLLPSAYSYLYRKFGHIYGKEEECGRQPQNDKMDLGRGLRPLRAARVHAAAHGFRSLRTVAVVRGAGESAQQPRHGDLCRGRQGARLVLRAEPFLRAVRRPLFVRFDAAHPARRPRGAADRRGAHRHGGCPLPQPFGHRHPLAGSRGGEDRAAAEHLAGRRLDHHAAARQESLPARHGPQPGPDRAQDEARDRQAQGVDHGPQASSTTTRRRRSPPCTSIRSSTARTPTA